MKEKLSLENYEIRNNWREVLLKKMDRATTYSNLIRKNIADIIITHIGDV